MECPTKNCDTPVKATSKMRYCVNCRSGMSRASRKGPRYLQHRAKQLDKFRDRIDNVTERKEKRNGR